jgi:hypothetical protein
MLRFPNESPELLLAICALNYLKKVVSARADWPPEQTMPADIPELQAETLL